MRTKPAPAGVLLVVIVACLFPAGVSGTRSGAGAKVDGKAITRSGPTAVPNGLGVEKTIRVYVSGESIEQRNRFVAPPFTSTGALNDRGGGESRNDNEEYGWMVPMAERLRLRDSSLRIEFVGADTWLDAEDQPYTGTYPSTAPGRTSAISGTDIPSWLEQRESELADKTHCYDVALASRGGNDFGNENDDDYKNLLKRLVRLLAAGSNCRANPIIYVTAHMPDDQRGGGQDPPDRVYVNQQIQRFVERTRQAVSELRADRPPLNVRFIDMYTPFRESRATTAFPKEAWSINGVPDYVKIGRVDDTLHPRRLASIYAGEIVADSLDLPELRNLGN